MPTAYDFTRRCEDRELIDDMTIAGETGRRMLDELRVVNTLLGGYRTTLSALGEILTPRGEPYQILDVGTGSGDIPEQVANWARRAGVPVRITAVDLNPATVEYAAERLAGIPEVSVRQADVFKLPFAPQSFDVACCALFLHHFRQPDAAHVLAEMYARARIGIVVSDLHRHPVACHGFRLMSTVYGASRLVRHDGPLSVRRAFSRADWDDLAARAGLPPFRVKWQWAFRWQAVCLRSAPRPAP